MNIHPFSPLSGALALGACLLAAPAVASPFATFFGLDLDVNRVSATEFEVIEARGAGPRDIWCAAADYATDNGVPGASRLYIAQGRGDALTAPGRKGVVFTTQGTGEVSGVSVSVRQVGYSLPVHHARQFCRDRIIELEDGF